MGWRPSTGAAPMSRASAGPASAVAASISGAAVLRRWLYSLCLNSRGNRCPTRVEAARSQWRSSLSRNSTWATARQTSSASVTNGRRGTTSAYPPGRDDVVNQFHIECDEQGDQVGDHEGSQV